jgi:hypothetical protein
MKVKSKFSSKSTEKVSRLEQNKVEGESKNVVLR